ncbi:MAG: FAD-binding protein [Hyphomicrobiales bacterium]
MSEITRPGGEDELAAVIAEAAAGNAPLEIEGAGTKRDIGRPLQTAARVSTSKLSGITLYEPSELFISVLAGTPLKTVEAELASNNQQLAFEPADLGPLLGGKAQQGTIGAVFATNLSGPRRVHAGAARDHFIGMRAVNGRGEAFKSGGRVMKNVTGYDLCRGLSGSWGTLAVMTEVTMKVLPKPEETRTLLIRGLTEDVAVEAMSAALSSPYEVSGALHLCGEFAGQMSEKDLTTRGRPVTLVRLENFSSFVEYRFEKLCGLLSAYGRIHALDNKRSIALWNEARSLKYLQAATGCLWRIVTPQRTAARIVAAIRKTLHCKAAFDWAGGLVWLEIPPAADASVIEVRKAVAEFGGHATLIRAEPSVRAAIDVFHPPAPGPAAITRKLKAVFDPHGILNPGRMYPGV